MQKSIAGLTIVCVKAEVRQSQVNTCQQTTFQTENKAKMTNKISLFFKNFIV